MIDLDNDFYKNPGKFIYECQNVVFENFDSSRKEFVKSKLRHNSYTDLKYFRGISDMTQFYKLCEWDYLYDDIDESEVTDFIYGDAVNGLLYCIIPMDDIGSFEEIEKWKDNIYRKVDWKDLVVFECVCERSDLRVKHWGNGDEYGCWNVIRDVREIKRW